jgi:aminoglycoside N3'-acetyltransferase
VIEQLVQVPYRQWVAKIAQVRAEQGQEHPLPTWTYRPTPDFLGNDFNKLGALLEQQQLVASGAVGNAITRCFAVRDAVREGVAHYRQDPLLFVKTGAAYQALADGVMCGPLYREKTVVDPALCVH